MCWLMGIVPRPASFVPTSETKENETKKWLVQVADSCQEDKLSNREEVPDFSLCVCVF